MSSTEVQKIKVWSVLTEADYNLGTEFYATEAEAVEAAFELVFNIDNFGALSEYAEAQEKARTAIDAALKGDRDFHSAIEILKEAYMDQDDSVLAIVCSTMPANLIPCPDCDCPQSTCECPEYELSPRRSIKDHLTEEQYRALEWALDLALEDQSDYLRAGWMTIDHKDAPEELAVKAEACRTIASLTGNDSWSDLATEIDGLSKADDSL